MAQSVDLSIATVIEHVGKNCVPQTKAIFFHLRDVGERLRLAQTVWDLEVRGPLI